MKIDKNIIVKMKFTFKDNVYNVCMYVYIGKCYYDFGHGN